MLKNKDITFIGIFAALVIVLQAIAEIVRLLGLPVSLALGLVPVLVAAELKGVKIGALMGLVFGLTSMVLAIIAASSLPIAVVIINPLVSVLPRVLVGVTCGGVYKALTKEDQSKARKIFNSATATLTGIVTNTVLFLAMFVAFSYGKTYGDTTVDFKWVVASVIAINTLIELIAFTVIVPAVVLAVDSWRKNRNDSI